MAHLDRLRLAYEAAGQMRAGGVLVTLADVDKALRGLRWFVGKATADTGMVLVRVRIPWCWVRRVRRWVVDKVLERTLSRLPIGTGMEVR